MTVTQQTPDEQIRVLQAELGRITNLYNRLLAARSEWERIVKAAFHKQAWDACVGAADYLHTHTSASRIYGIIYRILELPDRPKPTDIRGLKRTAELLKTALEEASQKEQPLYVLLSEIKRLRQVMQEQGNMLHIKTSTGESPCICPGCEMIRACDVVPEEIVTLTKGKESCYGI
jgi:hypothetical protein